jgi:UDP-N-acetylglucosamine--N-acetylmuramyl-(pentapeptide) pyrophosphoryl-undecaprenol N-acetylglucosamine transferase
MKKILIAAGGTGGHVIPAITCAKEFQRQGFEVHWLGTERGIEATLVPQAGFPLTFLEVSGVRGKSWKQRLLAPLQMVRALMQTIQVIRREKPALILGMGGYVSGPAGLAARLMRIPLVIHEQNSIPGVTNQILARLADHVLESFPGSFAKKIAASLSGNPVRAEIAEITPPQQRNIGSHSRFHLLVMGGSLGAKVFNDTLPEVAKRLESRGVLLDIRHQTGKQACEQTLAHYHRLGLQTVEVLPFIDDMANVYAWADLVICRAGALTVAEICAAGVASIMIPYPFAVDDHQTKNAAALVKADATILMPQTEMTIDQLTQEMLTLFEKKQRLIEMAQKARGLAQGDATQKIVQTCLNLCV